MHGTAGPTLFDERVDGMIAAITRSQGALALTIDSREPQVPPWLTRQFFRHVVSQLYHGEIASLEVCERLATLIDDPRAHRFLNIQIADERRHAALYHNYLVDLGGVSPVDAGLQRARTGIAAWTGSWHGLMVAVNAVLESEAIRTLHSAPRLFACPRLTAINQQIVRDEARHLAFGRVYLREHLPQLSVTERRHIYGWVQELWRGCTSDRRDMIGLYVTVRRPVFVKRWARQNRDLIRLGLVERHEIAPL